MDDRKLERYLGELEQHLAGIPVGDRAEILAEIQSHARDAKAGSPERDMDDILAALGAPAVVAQRYRTERGFPAASPVVKRQAFRTVALAMGCMMLVTVAAFGALAWRAWPLVKVSESGVSVLGGAIDVRADDLDDDDDDFGTRRIEGKTTPPAGTLQAVKVEFRNGKVEIHTHASPEIQWRCRVKGEPTEPKFVDGNWTLDLSGSAGARCDILVPEKVRTVVKGSNGKIAVERPRGPIEASLDNGKIAFEPDRAKKYKVDATVRNGKTDAFPSIDEPGAIPVKLALGNGKIEYD